MQIFEIEGIDQLCAKSLFKPGNTIAETLLKVVDFPWQALSNICGFVKEIGPSLNPLDFDNPRPGVWIHKTAVVAESAFIGENVIIGEGAEIRHCAFIRNSAVVGKGAVVGNSTELKNVILFDCVQVPHYNYIGDSILGYKAHMGAGAVTSNVKSDKTPVTVTFNNTKVPTGLKKFGAILGDEVEIGCGSVLNPGSIIGKYTHVYPLSMVRGFVPEKSIYKKQGEIVQKK
ncbi:MAG: UDP-N-acetylglucosamine pyrophosphorylase [Oscillospiraceae bacterium]|nr:UDP-N-acetylglucosamine pyrophosphorylase [Oscillospiraceae bacterium]